ncbi:MAG: flippase-like domain-containing protein [Prosthecobacter sp.]|nr:flippase-like domain-containing protein [Prosthecobacter sp.]
MLRRHGLQLLRLALGLGILAWVVRRVSLERLAAFPWRDIDPLWLLAAFVFGGLSVLGWAGRWWWFTRVYDLRPSFARLLRLTFYADFFNLYFLGPLGADGIRLLHLSRDQPVRRGAVLGSLLLDHVGGLAGGIALYLGFSRTGVLPHSIVSAADQMLPWIAGFTFLGLGVLMEPPIQRLMTRTPGLRRLAHWMRPVFAGTFRHPWLFAGFAVSALSTASAFAAFWAAARAVGCQVSLPTVLGLMPVVDLIASLPISLSGIGVREGLLVELLGSQPGCDPASALAASLLGFAAIGLWGLLGGVALLVSSRKGL